MAQVLEQVGEEEDEEGGEGVALEVASAASSDD